MMMQPILHAQHPDTLTRNLEYQIEWFIENTEIELDFSELTEEIEKLVANPVNINSRDREELRRLFFLNEVQIQSILAYTANYGDFVSIYELKALQGFDPTVIRKIIPFIKIAPFEERRLQLRDAITRGEHSILMRYQRILEKQEGYLPVSDSLLEIEHNARYLGSPDKILLKYGYDYRSQIRWGFLAEKDAGEEFFRGTQKQGFDFYSAYIYGRDLGKIHKMVVGDFHATFGQGLVMWSGLSFGKSGITGGMPHTARGLTPSTSSNEIYYLRGGGITLGLGNFEISTLASRIALDASTSVLDTLEPSEIIEGLRTTGLHRTISEVDLSKNIHLTTLGGNISYTGNIFKAGFTIASENFDKAFNYQTGLYNLFQQPRKSQFTIGTDVCIYLRDFVLQGEIARDVEGHLAGIFNANFQPDPRLTLAFIYRNYDKAFQNYHSNAFSENSGVYNEQGVYIGFRASVAKQLELTGYADYFLFPWFKYRVDGPSKGREYFIRMDLLMDEKTRAYLRYRFEQKEINTKEENRKLNTLSPRKYHNVRMHFDYQPIEEWKFASRAEAIFNYTLEGNSRMGFLIYQDVTWQPFRLPISISGRYALFDTETYDERLYAYEHDMLYSFSIPAYYYKGQRIYLILKYSLYKNLNFWLRFASSIYWNKDEIGTGLEIIHGNTRSEIKAQLIWKF